MTSAAKVSLIIDEMIIIESKSREDAIKHLMGKGLLPKNFPQAKPTPLDPYPDITFRYKYIEEKTDRRWRELTMARELGQKSVKKNKTLDKEVNNLNNVCFYCKQKNALLERAHVGPRVAEVHQALWEKYRKNRDETLEFFIDKCEEAARCYEITPACRKCNNRLERPFKGLDANDMPIMV
tara:strand:- start:820 stop:1362 length:543 start_codon:yes stop_codon:yes gene_type:complete